MTNVNALKDKTTGKGKGAPPPMDVDQNNLDKEPREKPKKAQAPQEAKPIVTEPEPKPVKEKQKALNFGVDESFFNEFSIEAYAHIGPGHGAKKGLLQEMWNLWKKTKEAKPS